MANGNIGFVSDQWKTNKQMNSTKPIEKLGFQLSENGLGNNCQSKTKIIIG